MSGRKLARRACDGCKIRKVKCSETTPCDGCRNANIPCTWLKQAQPRGPRRLREATLQEIRKAQDILHNQSQLNQRKGTTRSLHVNDPDPPPEPSSEIASLVLYLCVYRVQLYPVWPIIKVERLIASLQSETADVEVFALAYALAAATATRTQSTELSVPRKNHAEILEQKCQAARAKVPPSRGPNLTTARIAFFLHIYYESIEAASMKSMLYLREAVTIATMIGLHKESYFGEVPVQERELRRRVLWLLFVTEREVSVLYENSPITLRTRIDLPSTTDTDEAEVLSGFQLLVRLFWQLDERGFFGVLDDLDIQASPSSGIHQYQPDTQKNFADCLQTSNVPETYIPLVQRLDLMITRSWLHAMNLRIQQTMNPDFVQRAALELASATDDMIESMRACAPALFEVHGSQMQVKLSAVRYTLHDFALATQQDLPQIHDKFIKLAEDISQASKDKVLFSETGSKPSPMLRINSHVSLKSGHASGGALTPTNTRSPGYSWSPHGSSMPPIATGSNDYAEDFAANNNYERLFDAVQLAGLPSSDTVEDLFGHNSLEPFHTFDDPWQPPLMLEYQSQMSWQQGPTSNYGHG